MTGIIQPKNEARRHLVLGLAGWTLINAATANGVNMASENLNLWQLIEALTQKMPLTPTAIEGVSGIALEEAERDENFIRYVGKVRAGLEGGLGVTNLNLLIRPSLVFDEKSAFAFEVYGKCVGLAEIRDEYGALMVTQHPRGGSLAETTVYSKDFSWGVLSFSFKEERPECLFRVSFRQRGEAI